MSLQTVFTGKDHQTRQQATGASMTDQPIDKTPILNKSAQPTHQTNQDGSTLTNKPKQGGQPKKTTKAQSPTQTATQTTTADNPDQSHQSINQFLDKLPQTIQEELIVDWIAPARPFKKRSRQFFSTVAAIAILLMIIMVFANQIIFALVIATLLFMAYLLFSIPPQNIYYAITTFGIHIGEELYFWEEMGNFWFDKKYDQTVLMIEVARFPHRLTLVIFDEDKPIIRDILARVIIEHRPKPTLYEKWATWLAKTFPLEPDETSKTKIKKTRSNSAKKSQNRKSPAS